MMWQFLTWGTFALGVAAVILSYRARRNYESQLEQLRLDVERARQHVRRRAQLAQELAHEIKNPLAAIVSSAEALDLMLKNEIAQAHREALGYIREYGMDLLKQLSDFLDLNRAEGGYVVPQRQPVDVGRCAEGVCCLLQAPARKRDIQIRLSVPEPGPVTMMDPGHLKQIVFNLVHNAVKFSPPGGYVDVSVQQLGASGPLSLTISDQGPGIPTALRQRLFEPFVQGDPAPYSGERGTGLGLALCKSLAELAGGSIMVHSEEGRGSCFVVTLPNRPVSTAPDRNAEAPTHSVH